MPAWAVFSGVLGFCFWGSRKGPRAGLIFLWAAWLAACSLFSAEPLNSFWQLSLWLTYFISYFCAAACGGEDEKNFFVKLLLWTSALFSVFIIAGNICGADLAKLLLPPNQNYAAALISAGFVGSAWALLSEKGIKARFVWAALLLLAGAALLEIKSRGALLGAGAGFAYLCFYLGKKRLLAWVAGAVLLAALLFPAVLDPVLKKHQRFRYERVNIWKTAVLSALDKPLFGWGPGCFERAYLQRNFPAFNGLAYYNNYTGNAHSQLLQQAAETGVIGAGFFLLFFLPLFRVRDRGRLREAAMLLCLFAISLFDGIMALPLISATMFVLAAFLRDSEEEYRRGPVLAVLLFVGVGLVCGTAQQGLKKSAFAGPDAPLRADALNKLSLFQPCDDAIYSALAALAQSPAEAAELLERAVTLNPYNAVYRFRLAQALTALGARAKAGEELSRAVELEPNFQRAALALASQRLSAGDEIGARKLFESSESVRLRFGSYRSQSGYESELLSADPERVVLLYRAAEAAKRGKKVLR